MLEAIQKRKGLGIRILLGVVVAGLGVTMLSYLLPGSYSSRSDNSDLIVEVSDMPITAADVRRHIQRLTSGRQLPPALESLYARQVLDQLVLERLIELEAERMGIQVTRQEQADRIRRLLPSAQAGDMERYAAEVQERFQMGVAEFEDLVRKSMLQEKFSLLITDGITAMPEEVDQEFRRRSEKIKIEFVLIKPDDLESKIQPGNADLAAQFEKNKTAYQVPEKRVVRYALLDRVQINQRVSVSEQEMRAYYNQQIDRYRIQNRAHVSHILFKTVGKSDAEVEETRRKAEDVLKKARGSAKFEDLAKQYSEDTSKEKGGDLGWIIPGQTVQEFERAAFALPKGTISDLVKTQYGFHIIKVLEREVARTQPFEEVRGTILPVLQQEKADRLADDTADKIASAIRQNPRRTLDDLARQFGMTLGEAGPAAAREPLGELGLSPELSDAVFRVAQNELSQPIRLDRGYTVLALKSVNPAHQGTLDEVRDRVASDFRRAKAAELAKTRAEELAARLRSGTALAAAAKPDGLTVKTSDAFARVGSIPDVGSAKPLSAAFNLQPGEAGPATPLGTNWIVYRVVAKEGPKPEEVVRQMLEAQQAVLQSKRNTAYEAFREALRERMTREGKIRYNQENLKRLMRSS